MSRPLARASSGTEDPTGPGGPQPAALTETPHRSAGRAGTDPGAEPGPDHAGNALEVGDAAGPDQEHRGADRLRELRPELHHPLRAAAGEGAQERERQRCGPRPECERADDVARAAHAPRGD